MRRRRRTVRAFSLFELTLALAMMSVLSLAMYRSMSTCMKARATAYAAVEPVRASTIAFELIGHDLESVLPPSGLLAGPFYGLRQNGPTGNADAMQFCSIGSDGVNPRLPTLEGIRQIELYLRTDVSPAVLVRRITRNLLPQRAEEPEEEILCRGVRSLTVYYFDGMSWQDEWDSTVMEDVLPMAVRMELEMEDGGPAYLGRPRSRIVRVIPLACAKLPPSVTGEDQTGTGTSNTSGTGATGGTGGTGGTSGSTGGRSTSGGGGASGGGRTR